MITLLLASSLIFFPLLLAVRAHFRNLMHADSTAKGALSTPEVFTTQSASPYTMAASMRRRLLKYQAQGATGFQGKWTWRLSHHARATRSRASTLRLIWSAKPYRKTLSLTDSARAILHARHTRATQVQLNTSVRRTQIGDAAFIVMHFRILGRPSYVSKSYCAASWQNRPPHALIPRPYRNYGVRRLTPTTSSTLIGE